MVANFLISNYDLSITGIPQNRDNKMGTLSNIKPASARSLAGCYFAFLSIIATALIQLALFSLGMGDLIPKLMGFFLALPTGFIAGLLFGNAIISSTSKWRCFLWGFLMVWVMLPLYDLCLLFLLQNVHPGMYKLGSELQDYLMLYLLIITYSFVLIGSWLSILSGFSAIYLKNYFAPNVMNYSKRLNQNYQDKQANK